jgi:outer membrane receptor protein involved in Fe transport
MDKALTRTFSDLTANIPGLNALHQGVEFDFTSRPIKGLEIRGMLSVGDWEWTNDVIADVYNELQEYLGTVKVYSEGLKVSDAAQTTAAIGIDYEVLPRFKLGADFNHYDRLYAFFNVEGRADELNRGTQAWQMPAYQLVDINMKYDFKFGNFDASLYGKVSNLFDTEHITDATDGSSYSYDTAFVYFGFGRTWSASFRIRF